MEQHLYSLLSQMGGPCWADHSVLYNQDTHLWVGQLFRPHFVGRKGSCLFEATAPRFSTPQLTCTQSQGLAVSPLALMCTLGQPVAVSRLYGDIKGTALPLALRLHLGPASWSFCCLLCCLHRRLAAGVTAVSFLPFWPFHRCLHMQPLTTGSSKHFSQRLHQQF